jgi:hypothetical protein
VVNIGIVDEDAYVKDANVWLYLYICFYILGILFAVGSAWAGHFFHMWFPAFSLGCMYALLQAEKDANAKADLRLLATASRATIGWFDPDSDCKDGLPLHVFILVTQGLHLLLSLYVLATLTLSKTKSKPSAAPEDIPRTLYWTWLLVVAGMVTTQPFSIHRAVRAYAVFVTILAFVAAMACLVVFVAWQHPLGAGKSDQSIKKVDVHPWVWVLFPLTMLLALVSRADVLPADSRSPATFAVFVICAITRCLCIVQERHTSSSVLEAINTIIGIILAAGIAFQFLPLPAFFILAVLFCFVIPPISVFNAWFIRWRSS